MRRQRSSDSPSHTAAQVLRRPQRTPSFRCWQPHRHQRLHHRKRQRNSEWSRKATADEVGSEKLISGRHRLACGQELEFLSCHPAAGLARFPPLLFLHGAMHGAWCFAENFLPYFADRGYEAHAFSLRGHGESAFEAGASGSFAEQMDDLASVVRSLQRPPVLVTHSLGGIFAQRYLIDLAQRQDRPEVAGVVFMAAPALPAVLGPSFDWLKQLQGVVHGFQIVWWMTTMPKERAGLVQTLFFSQDLPDASFQRYHQKMVEQRTILPVSGRELTDYNRDLDKAALRRSAEQVPILVMIAGADRMVMPCQVDALAEMLGKSTVSVPGVGHDLMLDTRWRDVAGELDVWVQQLASAGQSDLHEQP